ncbi:MAG: hypothetical protein RIR51_1855 [Bacteroidota bacterium]|jgi:putative hydrolase of the HAD superfamily
MKLPLKAIFFDWDHTLWDAETNAVDTLSELFFEFKLKEKFQVEFSEFQLHFQKINDRLWKEYQLGDLSQEELRNSRFKMVFENFQILEDSDNFSNHFLYRNPRKKKLMAGAKDLVELLSNQFQLFILTNGFDEIQQIKVGESDIANYFQKIYTPKNTGFKKPNPNFFEFVLKDTKLKKDEVVMVGDNLEVDILGAENVGIKAIHYTPTQDTNFKENKIKYLLELQELLVEQR